MKPVLITVPVDPATRKRVKAVAALRGKSMAEMMRDHIDDDIREAEARGELPAEVA
ncbi:hypothetical protein ABZ468_42875 [Streptomyces sp. NPDC005708]|uniref:hypothetical protein n=1 Tax=Streptomyces sp. NPDC005708 TaxID=3154564 RepID=UPI0033CA5A5F